MNIPNAEWHQLLHKAQVASREAHEIGKYSHWLNPTLRDEIHSIARSTEDQLDVCGGLIMAALPRYALCVQTGTS